MKKEVLSFIKYMRSKIKERPQCLMFALLLKCKFDKAIIFYDSNHCITLINEMYYDWNGVVNKVGKFTKFPESWGYNHIVNHYNAIKEIFQRTEK